MIHPAAVALIREFEGCRLAPYLCPAGVWTIGYGATVGPDGKRVTRDTPAIDEAGAEALLARDLARVLAAVRRLIVVPLSGEQEGALLSFAFNLGAGALQASTLRRKVNAMEWAAVPAQFMRWTMAGGRVLPGLVRRRAAEVALWESGVQADAAPPAFSLS